MYGSSSVAITISPSAVERWDGLPELPWSTLRSRSRHVSSEMREPKSSRAGEAPSVATAIGALISSAGSLLLSSLAMPSCTTCEGQLPIQIWRRSRPTNLGAMVPKA